jgi:hypothetical protein
MNFYTFINRYTERSCIHFTSITIIIFIIFILIITCSTPIGKRTIFGNDVGGDFVALYISGKILNEYHPAKLYDSKIQSKWYHYFRPYMPADINLPNPYPPFFNILFRPLALIPYIYSYLLWLSISGALYLMGLVFILKSIQPIPRKNLFTILILACSFEPFIMECWIGGQTSSFGFFWMALSYYFFKRNKYLLSGFALGFCFYKPTLLIIILPVLLLFRNYKIFLGIILSGLMLIFISIYSVGLDTCLNWLHFAFGFAKASTGKTEILRTYKFIDIVAFIRLLFGNLKIAQWIIIVLIFVIWSFIFVSSLIKLKVENINIQELSIGFILTWTTVINIYFPIYDTIIVVIGVLLTINSLNKDSFSEVISSRFKIVLLFLYLTPWISQIIAKNIGFQPYTLILIILGILQMVKTHQMSERLNA